MVETEVKLSKELEDKLRVRAFYVFYGKIFADEVDPTVRFAKALVASANPIRDFGALAEWVRRQEQKRRGKGKSK